jgi:hypothetical protein
MAEPDPKPSDGRRLLGKVGAAACAFGVFLSGWMAMRTDDVRQMVLWTIIAAGCGYFASRFASFGR